jgi:glycine betaine/choline ABC-type transport system substrate-binding protein
MLKRRAFLAAPGLTFLSGCTSTPKLKIGAKDNIESNLISEIAGQLLEKKLQARLERRFGIPGSTVAYQSLQGGDMDVYPEYSRIAFKVLLKLVEQLDDGLMLDVLQKGFQAQAQANCFPFLGFENTHTAVIRADDLNFSDITNLSQAAESKSGWRLGCTSDFAQSAEGYNELKFQYKIQESGGTRLEPVNQLYFGLREKRIDILITGSTDPRLTDPRYRVLADDKRIFSPNRCTIVYSQAAALKYPSILPVLQSLSGKLDQGTMQRLNGEVEINKRGFAEVATEWLTKSGLA